ncbi:hypothetical protein IT415_02760 [bacterium]|nr:hypothetical protein [bacterium]
MRAIDKNKTPRPKSEWRKDLGVMISGVRERDDNRTVSHYLTNLGVDQAIARIDTQIQVQHGMRRANQRGLIVGHDDLDQVMMEAQILLAYVVDTIRISVQPPNDASFHEGQKILSPLLWALFTCARTLEHDLCHQKLAQFSWFESLQLGLSQTPGVCRYVGVCQGHSSSWGRCGNY